MGKFGGLLRTLGPVRLATIGVVTLILSAIFAWLIFKSGEASLALLYGDLDTTDAARIVQQLDAAKVPYRLAPDGKSLFVPEDQVAKLRVTLAEQGLPAGGSLGYEIFDRTEALGSTNFLQNVNLVRALEGELARTMRSIEHVKAARVHLVIPRRDLFSRERQDPSASVLLQMRGNSRLTPAQVSAVQHLIASAVPGLTAGHISIVDGQGTLLSGTGDDRDGDGQVDGQADERRRQLESRLARTIDQLLERTLGAGKVRAEVSAEMDFDRINSSEEIFNPDGQVVRSTQTVDEKSANADSDANAPVGVTGNLPDPNAASGGSQSTSSSEQRNEETVNYEISKKVINHVREAGTLKRLSVAVLVDGTYVAAADGTRTYQPRSAQELEQLASLVRSAVGFNKERGDTVEVVNMRFVELDLPADDKDEPIFGLERTDLVHVAEYLVLFIFAVLVLVLVVRPLVVHTVRALPTVARPKQIGGNGEALPALTGPDNTLPVPAQRPGEPGEVIEDMISVHNIEGQLKASTLRRFGEIVEKHPEETLAIIRTWLHSEE